MNGARAGGVLMALVRWPILGGTTTERRSSPPSPRGAPVHTSVTPPRLSSFPQERAQLEYSSRSLVFPTDGPRLLRAWGPTERPFVLAVAPGRSRWTVTAWGVGPARARAAAREMFSFDHPIEAFYERTRREPVLRGTSRRFRGLRIPRDATVYEALVHAVIGQQLSVVAARTIQRRLFDAVGAVLEVDGVEVPRVPTPTELLELGADGLRRVGLSRAKSSSILGLARREAEGGFPTRRLGRAPVGWAVERLDREPGVGRWTAENALLRGAGRCDVFLAGDLGLRGALAAYGAVPKDRPEEVARAWGDAHYPGWGSYATLYLWRRWVEDGTPAG
jgi:DNA-3-methyladenine glycosylase II